MKFILIFVWLLFITATVVSQTTEDLWKVEDGWKGLIPFQSTKADVEKVLGKGIRTKKQRWYQYKYDTEDAVVMFDYAGKPCEKKLDSMKDADSMENFDIPENTIFAYQVQLKQLMPTTEFTFNENRFERDVSLSQNNEPLPHFSYKQFRFELWKAPNEWTTGIGIEFWGDNIQDVDYVRGFYFGPPHDDLEKRRCEKTNSQQPLSKNK